MYTHTLMRNLPLTTYISFLFPFASSSSCCSSSSNHELIPSTEDIVSTRNLRGMKFQVQEVGRLLLVQLLFLLQGFIYLRRDVLVGSGIVVVVHVHWEADKEIDKGVQAHPKSYYKPCPRTFRNRHDNDPPEETEQGNQVEEFHDGMIWNHPFMR